jgi:phage major head subunit gpT-like protein
VPDTLVVGRSNRAVANKLINAELINDGGVPVDNQYKGMYKLIYSPLLP